VQSLRGSAVVFRVENGVVRPLPVVVGRQADGRTEILEGLRGGETLAGTNTYLLKSELEQRRK
jgi:cobalt-zinc-cadmium efflux system membrane fusion protein